MPDDFEFTEEPPPGREAGSKVQAEASFFGTDVPPNTVLVKLWSGGHLSWHSDSSAPVLALIMLMILCLLVLLLALVSVIFKGAFGDLFQILGNAISAVVGAVVGSSASAIKRRR